MTYRLYYSPGSCSTAAHIVLEEVGASFELQRVPLEHGGAQAADFLAVNPKGRVPALAIDGEPNVLTELPAILLYLARRHASSRMLPDDSLDEARCVEWLAWLAGWVHGMGYGALWRPERFVESSDHYAAVQANGRHLIESAYLQIERRLADAGSWAMPCGYSIVDPFLLVLYRWGTRIGLPMLDSCPAWRSLVRQMLERPAVKKVLLHEGLSISA